MAYPLYQADLRKIRESNGMSIDDMSRKTHITPDVLLQFEETGLLNHPRFNNVYLRALVKTICEALNIPVNAGVSALEESLEGNYEGSLRGFLDGKALSQIAVTEKTDTLVVPVVEAPSQTSNETIAASAVDVPTPKMEAIQEVKSVAKSTKGKAKTQSAKPLDILEVEIKPTKPDTMPIPKTIDAPQPDVDTDIEDVINALTQEESTPTDEVVVVNADTVKKAEATEIVSARKPVTLTFDDTARTPRTSNLPPRQIEWEPEPAFKLNPRSLIIGLCVLIIVGGAIWLLGDQSGWWASKPTPVNSQPAENGNTNSSSTTTPQKSALSLPDSMKITMIAANGTISPAYVVKDDAIKPLQLWIERGDSTSVYAKQKLVINSKNIKSMTLKVQGKMWTIAGQDTAKSVTLTRETIQNMLK